MISEAQQEQAALYALDSLGAEEAADFERELSVNAELRAFVVELRETTASLALAVPQRDAPAALKSRLLQQIEREAATKVVRFPTNWIPWAIAAALALFCGMLAYDRAQLQRRVAATSTEPVLVALAATPDAPATAGAVVAWEPAKQAGVIKIRNLPAAATGKDYQLWAVDAEHKDPVDAGILRVDANGVAQVEFKPKAATRNVKAFAISLEREGGVPKKEGPIVLVGSV